MNSPRVTLQSITGVDVQLQIAGAGSRSYAFVIDWHIRLVLAIAWFFAAMFIYTGSFMIMSRATADASGGTLEQVIWVVILPAAAIYFLYHPILEVAMHGRTPGKRMAGVRLVTRTGDIPGPGALLLRNVFRLVDSLPAMYVVGLTCVVVTSQHVRIGDLAAGTLLVLDRPESETSFASLGSGQIDARSADLAQELLDRWRQLDSATRANLARSLIARLDPAAAAGIDHENDAQLRDRLQRLLASGKTA